MSLFFYSLSAKWPPSSCQCGPVAKQFDSASVLGASSCCFPGWVCFGVQSKSPHLVCSTVFFSPERLILKMFSYVPFAERSAWYWASLWYPLQVWCVGNVSGLQMQLNQSVSGEVLHVLVDDLMPEILYSVQVVAVTSAGPGETSEPVFILISECLLLTAAFGCSGWHSLDVTGWMGENSYPIANHVQWAPEMKFDRLWMLLHYKSQAKLT